jgi:pimeloyl-ACP methyl ester carboxylesterase
VALAFTYFASYTLTMKNLICGINVKLRHAAPAVIILGLFSAAAYCAGTGSEKDFAGDLSRSGQQAAAPLPALAIDAVPSPYAGEKNGRDLTGDFKLAWEADDSRMGANEIAELRKYKVILVPGFLSNTTTRPVSIFGMKVELGKYFGDQMLALRGLGIDYELAAIESEETPAFNAVIIAKEIEASPKPVILMGHSKGGLDIFETLIRRKDLRSKVKGIVTIQTPYFGSPIADSILHNKILAELSRQLLKAMGGSINSLRSLDTRQRDSYYRGNLAEINEIVRAIPVITMGTWKDEVKHKMDTVLEPLRDEMLEMGMKNDGQVPIASAILPGTDNIKIQGMDHFVTVMKTGNVLRYDRVRLTRTLLLMINSKMTSGK